ncbi:MAG: tetratricopeptide repeat protein [Chitinophagales bacterium]
MRFSLRYNNPPSILLSSKMLHMKFLWIAMFSIAVFVATSCNHPNEAVQKNNMDSLVGKDSTDPQINALSEKIKSTPKNPELYFLRSNIFLQHGNIPASFSDMSDAIALDSTNIKYYFAIADIYLKGGSADGAIDAFNHIIRTDPENTEALIKLSKVYFYQKDYKNSMQQLARVQELDKDNFETWFIRGLNFKETGDTSRAITSFQKSVQIKPDFYDGYMQLGLITGHKKNSPAAQYFDNAIRIDSTTAEAYYAKAMYYQEHGENEKAKSTYEALITVNPQFESSYFNLGYIYIKQDSIDKAYRMFDFAIKVKPAYAEAYYYRGLCAEEKGNKEQAISDFRQALTLKPGYELAQKELNTLTQSSK